jgi:hypothetical protein
LQGLIALGVADLGEDDLGGGGGIEAKFQRHGRGRRRIGRKVWRPRKRRI